MGKKRRNKSSAECTIITNFDRAVAEESNDFLPKAVSWLRALYFDSIEDDDTSSEEEIIPSKVLTDNKKFSELEVGDHFLYQGAEFETISIDNDNIKAVNVGTGVNLNIDRSTLQEYEEDEEDNTDVDVKELKDKINKIESKLHNKKELTKEEHDFILEFNERLLNFRDEVRHREEVEDYISKRGHMHRIQESEMYEIFNNMFPGYAHDLLLQVTGILIDAVSCVEDIQNIKETFPDNPELIDMPFESRFVAVVKEYYPDAKIMDDDLIGAITYYCRQQVKEQREECEKAAEREGISLEQYCEQGATAIQAFDKLMDDSEEGDKRWEALMYNARHLLFEATHLKIGDVVSYAKYLDEEDTEEHDEDGNYHSAEEEGPEHYLLKLDNISGFLSMPREVRSILYCINNGDVGILMRPSVFDAVALYKKIMGFRTGVKARNSKEFMQALKQEAERGTDWARSLYDYLNLNANKKKRTMVFNVFNRRPLFYSDYKRKTEFRNTTRGDESTNSKVTVFYRNSGKASDEELVNHYNTVVLDIEDYNNCVFRSDGTIVTKQANAYAANVRGRLSSNTTQLVLFSGEKSQEEARINFIKDVSIYLNLHLMEDQVEYILADETRFEKFCSNALRIVSIVQNGTHKNINDILKETNYRNVFRKFLKVARYDLTIFDTVSPSEDAYRYNKSYFYHNTTPTALGDRMEDLARHVQQGTLREYLENTYFKNPIYATKIGGNYIIHNVILEKLYNEADPNDKEKARRPYSFTQRFLNEVTRGLGWSNKEFERFSEKDNILYTLNAYFTSIAEKETLGVIPLFVTGDSNSNRYLNIEAMNAADIEARMVDAAYQEYTRMRQFKAFIDYCESRGFNYRDKSSGGIFANQDKFSYFEILNGEEFKNEINGVTTEEEQRKIIEKYVKKELAGLFGNFKDFLLSKGIITYANAREQTSIIFNNEELYIPDFYAQKDEKTVYRLNDQDFATAELYKFWLNQKFYTLSELQFFTVDPAFYMGTEDMQKRFKEMIAAGNSIDETALDPSDISKLVNDKFEDDKSTGHAGEGFQEVLYLSDMKHNTLEDKDGNPTLLGKVLDFLGFNEKQKNPYTKASLTDGQSYRSFSSYRKICVMAGTWTDEMEEVYTIIKRSRDTYKATHNGSIVGHRLSDGDFKRIQALNVVFQPLKPFYFGFENVNLSEGVMNLPVQLKYSEYPLIPELLPLYNSVENQKKGIQNRLTTLGYVLEDNKIDLAAYTTCVKVGGFGDIDISKCTDANSFNKAFRTVKKKVDNKEIEETNEENFRDRVHKHYLRGYKIQSNIPEHYNSSRARGTQAAKHAYGSLLDSEELKEYGFIKDIADKCEKGTKQELKISDDPENGSIDIEGGKISPKNLVRLVGILESYGFIKATLKLCRDFNSPIKIAKNLTSQKANDTRAAKDKLGAYSMAVDGELRISPAEGVDSTDNIATLLSKARKDIIKQKIFGGSAVQVSAYGFEDVLEMHIEEHKDPEKGTTYRVLQADSAVPFNFSYTIVDNQGREQKVFLNYDEYVDRETGMLYDENRECVEPGEGKSKLEKEFPGILDMVTYRIPTEKDYSMIYVRPKRFFPMTCGGIIMLPTVFTAIAGFDFDIDKLYFFRKEFVYHFDIEETLGRIDKSPYDVWNAWYDTSEGRKMFPYLVMNMMQDVVKASEANPIVVDEESSAQRQKVQRENIEIIENFKTALEGGIDSIKEMINRSEFSDVKRLAVAMNLEKTDYIDYYSEALQQGDFSSYLPTKEETFRDFIQNKYLTSSVRRNLFVPMHEYDTSKHLLDQNQVVINNMFVQLMIERLCDNDTLKERLTSGGYHNHIAAKPTMLAIRYSSPEDLDTLDTEEAYKALQKLAKKGVKPNYNPTEPTTITHYQTYNATYDGMIGVSANISINLRPVALTSRFVLKKKGTVDSVRTIRVGSMIGQNDGTGYDFKTRFLNNGQDTELNTTECLTASVDAVKDALLEYFGIDLTSLPSASILLRLGGTPEDVGIFLNQPIIARALIKVRESDRYLSLSDAMELAYKDLERESSRNIDFYKTKSEFQDESKAKALENALSLDSLSRCFSPRYQRTSEQFLVKQIAVMVAMLDLQNVAEEMTSQINVSKTTSQNTIKSTMGGVQSMEQRAETIGMTLGGVDSNFSIVVSDEHPEIRVIHPNHRIESQSAAEKLLARYSYSPYCTEMFAYWAVMTYCDKVIGELFPYRTTPFKEVANIIGTFTKQGYMTEDMFNAFNKEFMLFFLFRSLKVLDPDKSNTAKVVGIDNKGNKVTIDTGMHPMYFYNSMVFPSYFESVIKANETAVVEKKTNIKYKDYAFIQAIYPGSYYDKDFGLYEGALKMNNLGAFFNTRKDQMIQSIYDAWNSGDPMLRDLTEHVIFYYGLYKGGFDFIKSSFLSLTPLKMKENILEGQYRDFFTKIFKLELNSSAETVSIPSVSNRAMKLAFKVKDFIKIFFRNHCLGNKAFYSVLRTLNNADVKTLGINLDAESFTVDVTKQDRSYKELASKLFIVTRNLEGKIVSRTFTPCVIINDKIYICDRNINSDNVNFNVLNDGENGNKMTYYRMRGPIGCDMSNPETTSYAKTQGSNIVTKYGDYAPTGEANAMVELLRKISENSNFQLNYTDETSEEAHALSDPSGDVGNETVVRTTAGQAQVIANNLKDTLMDIDSENPYIKYIVSNMNIIDVGSLYEYLSNALKLIEDLMPNGIEEKLATSIESAVKKALTKLKEIKKTSLGNSTLSVVLNSILNHINQKLPSLSEELKNGIFSLLTSIQEYLSKFDFRTIALKVEGSSVNHNIKEALLQEIQQMVNSAWSGGSISINNNDEGVEIRYSKNRMLRYSPLTTIGKVQANMVKLFQLVQNLTYLDPASDLGVPLKYSDFAPLWFDLFELCIKENEDLSELLETWDRLLNYLIYQAKEGERNSNTLKQIKDKGYRQLFETPSSTDNNTIDNFVSDGQLTRREAGANDVC